MSKELKEHKTSNLEFGGMSPPSRVGKKSWLSEVPANWEIVLVKHLFRFNASSGIPRHDRILSLTQRGIVERDVSGNEGQLAESYDKYPEIEVGDFALNPMDLVAGWVARTDIPGKISGAYYSFHLVDEDRANPDFYEYLFQSYYREKIFDPFGSGLGRMESGGGRWTLGRYVFMNFPVPLPPVEEQQNLVAYLDQETSKIDLLISKKEQLIEKLLERRQALITQVVTKGLDPDVPMKDSGVKHVGQIPSTWKIIKLGNVCTLRNGHPFDSDDFQPDGDIPLVRIRDIKNKAFSTFLGEGSKIPKGAELKHGDVVIGMDGDFNSIFWTRGSAALNQRLCYLRFTDLNVSKFVSYAIEDPLRRINEITYSTTVKHLASGQVAKIPMAIPNQLELGEIVEHLDEKIKHVDNLVTALKSAIGLLLERRQALITQVVTGKLDVRGFSDGDS